MEEKLLRMKDFSEVRAELLSHLEIEDRLVGSSIVYLPLGALEFHGPHLPTGLDGLTAHGICAAAARLSGGVVLPTMYQGTGGEHSDYPWTLMMPSGQAIAENLLAMLRRLDALGVKTAVVLSGHFADEQRAMLKEIAINWPKDRSMTMRVITRTVADCDVAPVAPDHAGVFESLLLAAIHPDLVNVNKLPELSKNPSLDPEGNKFGSHRHSPNHALWGVFGPDPREIDIDKSAELFAALVEWLSSLASKD
jgi:creatinine amidohydrolase